MNQSPQQDRSSSAFLSVLVVCVAALLVASCSSDSANTIRFNTGRDDFDGWSVETAEGMNAEVLKAAEAEAIGDPKRFVEEGLISEVRIVPPADGSTMRGSCDASGIEEELQTGVDSGNTVTIDGADLLEILESGAKLTSFHIEDCDNVDVTVVVD